MVWFSEHWEQMQYKREYIFVKIKFNNFVKKLNKYKFNIE